MPSTTDVKIASSAPGDIRYRNRRLLVLYFDMTAMPPPDLLRAYNAARKFINTQMTADDLVAVMAFQGGGVRVKQDFTDDRPGLLEVVQTLVFGKDTDGDGIPDTLEEGTAFGQDDAEFAILNTDRQLAALQTAVGMLRPLPDQKSLVYFASGLKLNGVDNQAQLRATTNAALRANVSIFPVDARGLVATPPLGDATKASPGGLAMFNGQTAGTVMTNFQRSQDTLYSLAKDTGGKAMFDYNDLSLGIVQAAQAVTSYYIVGFYSNHTALDGKFHRVKITLNGGLSADVSYRQGYFADKEFAKFNDADKERQLEDALMLENPVTDITDRDGGELLPAQPRRVLRAGGGEDSWQRARAGTPPRGRAHDDRFHRRGEGRVRDHDPERARQARHQAERRHRRPAREASHSVRNRVHAAARQVRDQAPGARCGDGTHRHVPDVVRDSEPESGKSSAFRSAPSC